MNVLLISPEFPDAFWSFRYALKIVHKRAALPPLGLLTVAALLPRDWDARLVDMNAGSLTDDDLAWADMALAGAMVAQTDSARRVLERCRKAGVRTVAGGPLFTCEPHEFGDVDHLVLNEAEITFPEFLRDLERGEARRVYSTSARPEVTGTPAPRWELADLDRYGSMSVQYSRGCPFDCEFCNVTSMFGHRPRVKAAAQVIAELDGLWERGWRGRIFFVDDNLIGNKRRLRTELLPALIEWKRDKPTVAFYTEASINLADDPELMALMVAAGFDTVFVGVETPAEASLAECSKKQNRGRDLVADVKRIQRAGMQVQGGFIVGFDSDRPSIFERQIELIQRSGIVTAMVGILQAPHGTKLHARLKKEGRLLGRMLGDNIDGTTNIIPKMNLDTLREGHRRILRHIYAPGPFYRRVRTFLREYRRAASAATPCPTRRRWGLGLRRLGRNDLTAGLRCCFHLGIVDRERLHFWKLVSWTLLHRPRLLPVAMTLAVDGYHCRRICTLHLA